MNRQLRFHGKQWHHEFVDGTDKAYTMEEIKVPEGRYYLAGDVWWRSGTGEGVPKDKIKGKVIGWIGKKGLNSQ